jgi:enamine deaminase RidA (YjgF/YER057c/UK114 family)
MFTVISYSEFISKRRDVYVATVLSHIICILTTICFNVACYIHDTDWLADVTSV